MKRLFTGIKNSQRIRVIINGVALFMEAKDVVVAFGYPEQRVAVGMALEHIGTQKLRGYGRTYDSYDSNMNKTTVDLQVDLL